MDEFEDGVVPVSENSDNGDSDQENHTQLIAELIARSHTLLVEVEALQKRLRRLRQEGTVAIAPFRSTIQSELTMLERLSAKPADPANGRIARCSNLPFLETVWAAAKRSGRVVSLQKRVFYQDDRIPLSHGMRNLNVNGKKRGQKKGASNNVVAVDAITEGGRVWIKVSLVTNTRLLFDLAKQGWESAGSESDGPRRDDANGDDDDDDRDVPLLKTAKDLARASRQFRIHTKQPQIHLLLPRVQPGVTVEVDNVLDACRATGALLFFDVDLFTPSPIDEALGVMVPDPIEKFTATLNVDCTILLALVSEFSHARVCKEPWFHTALQRQVEIEDNENLLPSLLYPAMGDRR